MASQWEKSLLDANRAIFSLILKNCQAHKYARRTLRGESCLAQSGSQSFDLTVLPQTVFPPALSCANILLVPRINEIRLMVKIAHLYHEQNVRQKQIADLLGVHQTTVSRLLRRAREENIARITVAMPPGIFADIESAIEQKFGLKQAIVIDTQKDEEHNVSELGSAAAFYVETTVKPGSVMGISSWSRSLFAMVEAMHATNCCAGGKVVQMMGGVGTAETYQYATHLVLKLANLVGADPVLLQSPGIVGSVQAQRVLSREATVRKTIDLFRRISLAIVGIGTMEPTSLLARSGNAFSSKDRREIQRLGAVGDICLRFYDSNGRLVRSSQNSRVIGMELETLMHVERVVGVAGGPAKVLAILGALRGRLINVLITDRVTAERVLAS